MTIAFYRGKTPIAWLIRVFTFGPFSHVEICFRDGEWFGARAKDGRVSVKCRSQALTGRNLYQWDFVPIKCTPDMEQRAKEFILPLIGRPFDYLLVWRWIFPWIRKSDALGCSEAVALVLGEIGISACGKSPNSLARILRVL